MSNAAEMDAQEIINYIATAPKKTPVKLYVREKPGMKVAWGDAHVYGGRRGKTVFGDWDELKAILDANADSIDYYDVENDCRNSAVPMLDLKGINARIEPGAIIRDRVEIGDRAVIMMGAIINIGSVIGEGSMIDMGAVLGGRATVGKNCHIGAGTVLAGVVEPASATPVIIEDDVMIGANAVVLAPSWPVSPPASSRCATRRPTARPDWKRTYVNYNSYAVLTNRVFADVCSTCGIIHP